MRRTCAKRDHVWFCPECDRHDVILPPLPPEKPNRPKSPRWQNDPPSDRHLGYLRHLAEQRGVEAPDPATKGEGAEAIVRLLAARELAQNGCER